LRFAGATSSASGRVEPAGTTGGGGTVRILLLNLCGPDCPTEELYWLRQRADGDTNAWCSGGAPDITRKAANQKRGALVVGVYSQPVHRQITPIPLVRVGFFRYRPGRTHRRISRKGAGDSSMQYALLHSIRWIFKWVEIPRRTAVGGGRKSPPSGSGTIRRLLRETAAKERPLLRPGLLTPMLVGG